MMDLIARLEVAKVGSRELDAELMRIVPGSQVVGHFGDYEWRSDGTGVWRSLPVPTKSIDAALGLAERVLPGWLWSVGTSDDGSAISVLDDLNASGGFAEARAHTPALAMCISILRAKLAEEPAKG